MSTRSVIVITGKDLYGSPSTLRLYKHSDGYPSGNLPLIQTALAKHLPEVAEAQANHPDSNYRINPDGIAGLIIGAAAGLYGMGARLEQEYGEAFKPEHLGNQGDLEWLYVVDTEAKTLHVYGGGYTGEAPPSHVKRGSVDPCKYADQLREEYQSEERASIAEEVSKIEALGFRVNPPQSRKPRAKGMPRGSKTRGKLTLYVQK